MKNMQQVCKLKFLDSEKLEVSALDKGHVPIQDQPPKNIKDLFSMLIFNSTPAQT